MTIRRLAIEPLEINFSPRRKDWPSNISVAQEWLYLAFLGAANHYKFEPLPSDRDQLASPPMSAMAWTLERGSGNPSGANGWPFVKNAGTALYAYKEGLSAEICRDSLSKTEKRAADALGEYFVSTDRIWQKGRPVEVDIPLILYLTFSIEAFVGSPFPMSRPNAEIKGKLAGKKPPEGPAFRLLQAAYALASVRQHVMPSGAETVYKVVRIARGESFKKQIVQCRLHPWVGEPNPELSLSWTVAAHPSQCAILFAEAVKARGGEPI